MDDLSLSEDDRSSRDSDGESEDQDRRSNKSENSDEDGQVRSGDDQDKSVDDEISDDDDSGDETEINVSNIRLCSEHPSGSMTRDCKICSDGIALMRPSPAVLQKLLGSGASNDPDNALLSRYGSRCDEISASLTLSQAVIKLAKDTFTKGTFRDQKKWKDVIKDYLTLKREDHESLSEDLNPESLFNSFKKEKRFKGIFTYANDIKDSLKNLRLSQRPVFKVVQVVNSELQNLRNIGEADGVAFVDVAPPRAEAGVPRHGRQLLDNLKVKAEIGTELFKRPELSSFIQEAGLSEALTKKLVDIFEDQREMAANKYLNLFEHVAEALTSVDDQLIFYLDLYSHVDGLFRDLLRDKLASLFKVDIKSEVIKDSDSKTLAKKKATPKGIFGGIPFLFPVSYLSENFVFQVMRTLRRPSRMLQRRVRP